MIYKRIIALIWTFSSARILVVTFYASLPNTYAIRAANPPPFHESTCSRALVVRLTGRHCLGLDRYIAVDVSIFGGPRKI